MLTSLPETPFLLLDPAKVQRNADYLRERLTKAGVRLRPHVKTAKSIEVALLRRAARANHGVHPKGG
jgi:D-serine deaminase-like pyridoxal phosphate-dependent protein